ncbi:hypothetical protein EGW08_019162, partial [Elysia chlorotica]
MSLLSLFHWFCRLFYCCSRTSFVFFCQRQSRLNPCTVILEPKFPSLSRCIHVHPFPCPVKRKHKQYPYLKKKKGILQTFCCSDGSTVAGAAIRERERERE